MSLTQWNEPRLVNTATTKDQEEPSVIAMADGGYIVFYQDSEDAARSHSPNSSIDGQRYNALGQKVGAEFQIRDWATDERPHAAALPDGGWVVWSGSRGGNLSQNWPSSVETFNADGTARSGLISLGGAPRYGHGDLAVLADGSVIVSWGEDRDFAPWPGHIKVISPSGVAGATVNFLPPNGGATNPQVASNGTVALVAFDARVDTQVRMSLIDAATGTLTGAQSVIVTDSRARISDVIVLSDGRFLVSWNSSIGGSTARIIAADGVTMVGSAFTLGASNVLDILPLADGGFYGVMDVAASSLTVQRFDSAGAKVGGAASITLAADAQGTDVAMLADGRLVVTWSQAGGGDPSGKGVQSMIVDLRDGMMQGGAGADLVTGSAAADTIRGLDGADVLYGLAGNDTLTGGAGSDTLWGGGGFDVAVFGGLASDPYTVEDLGHGHYRLTTVADGVDLLYGIERLDIAGTIIDLPAFRSVAKDLDADGDAELFLISQSTGAISRASITGGVLSAPVLFGVAGANWVAQGSGDFNGDGFADLVLKNTSTGHFGLWGSQNGVMLNVVDLNIGTNFNVAATGDYNGDGVSDLLWRDSTNGQLFVSLLGDAMTQINSWNLGVIGTDWTAEAAGDFDSDGRSDILLRNTLSGQLYLWSGGDNANGASLAVFGADWTVAGIGDFNGDGNSDIAIRNGVTGQFYLMLMQDDLTYLGSNLGVIGTDINIAATGDYNGDGTDDLIWRSAGDQVYLWAMQDGRQDVGNSGYLAYQPHDLVIL